MKANQWGYSRNDGSAIGDIPVFGDFDGDNKTDIGVWRTAFTNELFPTVYYILRSSDNTIFALVSVDSQNNLYFYILRSSNNKLGITQFGHGLADAAVPGDYDGDGKTDIAVWRGVNKSTSGLWFWIRSSDGNIGVAQLGTGLVLGDNPVQGDYDGDGTTDPAIYRKGQLQTDPSYFHIIGSQSGYYAVQWGLGSDIAPLR